MQYTLIKDLFAAPEQFSGRTVTVSGWARTIRDSKRFGFIELNDGTFFKSVQVVFEQAILNNYEEIAHLGSGSALTVTGTIELTPEAKQPFELKAREITVDGTCPGDYPLQKKRHSFEYLRSIPHLRARTNTFMAVFRIRSLAAFAIHQFFRERGFVYVHTPIITGSDCEGAGEMFRVTCLDPAEPPRLADGAVDYAQDFFGKPVNLTVSGQLMAEAYALAFRNVYTFGPTFRAENSFTPRHAAEFWMIEPEMAYAELSDYMDTAEDMVKYIINYCLENAPEEMAFFNNFVDKGLFDRLENVVSSQFKRITYTQTIDLLTQSGREFNYPVEWGCDLATEHEKYITEEVFHCPVFVTDYPKDIKAFYMRLNDDGRTVAAADLLVPGVGEIIGGSQREERLALLEQRMDEMHLSREEYQWYLELRKFGGVKHSGYGLGFERIIMYLTGMGNIRDAIPFPRTTGNAVL